MQTSAVLSSLIAGAALPLFACSRGGEPAGSRDESSPPSSAARTEQLPELAKGAPRALGVPPAKLDARPGQFALVPLRSAIDQALRPNGPAPTLVYVGARVVRVGEETSDVRWLTEQRGAVPNAFVVPIRPGERARRGDVVLTSFASGSGLQRAVVVSEGESATPRVRYLDPASENPTGWAAEEDTLPADTFHALRTPGEVGSTLACREGGRVEHVVVTLVRERRRVGVGFAGALRDVSLDACRALPLVPDVRPGDAVFVPWVGVFTAAKVTAVDAAAGRVAVRFDFGAEARETRVGFTNVATELP